MKYLHKLNELIRIENFSLDSLAPLVGQKKEYKDLLQDINNVLADDKIRFIDRAEFDSFYNEHLSDQPPPPPAHVEVLHGVNFTAFFPQASEDILVVTNHHLDFNFKNTAEFGRFKRDLEPLIVHELIHTKQAAQKDSEHIHDPDVSDFASYVSSPDELMAWSNTIAHEIFRFSDVMPKDLIKSIKRSRSGFMVNKHFPDKDDPIRKKFIKYIYQYLDEMYDKEKANPTKKPKVENAPMRRPQTRKAPIKRAKTTQMSVKDIEAAIDDALDNGDFATVKKLYTKLTKMEKDKA